MASSHIKCHYCDFKHDSMQSILMHHKEKHVNQFIKVRQPVLCPITGILKEQTKQYPFKYASLGDQEDIIFDTVSNTVRHTKHSSTSLQLSLCGSEQNETINNARMIRWKRLWRLSLMKKRDLDHLINILPDALQTLKDSGLIYEYIKFTEMLANKSFPLKNIAF